MQPLTDPFRLNETSKSYGGHSMVSRLRRVIVRRPANERSEHDWRAFGYNMSIDQEETELEHAAFVNLIESHGVDVILAGPDPAGALDAIFPFDPSIMTNAGALLLRPGKRLRREEVRYAEATYFDLGIPILGRITEPGTVEGGDTMWIDEQTLAVGRTYRTNAEGIRQLTALLAPIGVTVIDYDVPHFHGPGECLHLLSFISPVAEKAAIVHPPMMPVALIQDLLERDWQLIEAPDHEYDTQATNVLALAPGQLLALDGNPVTRRRLELAGYEVETYVGHNISLNRFGGPTCLTRPILRGA
jgi:N-dimethylarginine dimethylaminohydrolase